MYAPMNHDHNPVFPNRLPIVYWKKSLPKFKDKISDDLSLHMVRFHMHIHNLGVELHGDSLMKMFMVSLEGNAQSWYERFPS